MLEGDKNSVIEDTSFEYASTYLTRTQRMLLLRGPLSGFPYRNDFSSPTSIGDDILALNVEDHTQPIILLIDSQGGEVFTGFGLYDIIKTSKAPIITLSQTVASMAVIIAIAGTKRYSFPHSRFMIHLPSLLLGGSGKAFDSEEIRIQGELLQNIKRELVDTYIECGVTAGLGLEAPIVKVRKKILADMDRDYWLTAPEALKYGLIDEIVDNGEFLTKIKRS